MRKIAVIGDGLFAHLLFILLNKNNISTDLYLTNSPLEPLPTVLPESTQDLFKQLFSQELFASLHQNSILISNTEIYKQYNFDIKDNRCFYCLKSTDIILILKNCSLYIPEQVFQGTAIEENYFVVLDTRVLAKEISLLKYSTSLAFIKNPDSLNASLIRTQKGPSEIILAPFGKNDLTITVVHNKNYFFEKALPIAKSLAQDKKLSFKVIERSLFRHYKQLGQNVFFIGENLFQPSPSKTLGLYFLLLQAKNILEALSSTSCSADEFNKKHKSFYWFLWKNHFLEVVLCLLKNTLPKKLVFFIFEVFSLFLLFLTKYSATSLMYSLNKAHRKG